MRDLVKRLDRAIHWHWLDTITQYAIDQATSLQQIAAPTFQEANRADYVLRQFQALGLQDTKIDDLFNVYGRLPGVDHTLPAVMVSAHTDTVFPLDTDLSLKQEGNIIYGPGLGDNCFGLGGLLGMIAALRQQNIVPTRDIWCVAPSREEGLGDLGGMKRAFHSLAERIGYVINLEGLAFGHIYHGGIAVRRLRITASADGGHSWLHFGRASAVHGIVQLGAKILALEPPQTPRTTFNIGMIEGGQGINVIASSASLWLDMRSENHTTLAAFENAVRQVIASLQIDELSYKIEVVGDRPAGHIPADHPLVIGALAALSQVNVQGILETGSTDANVSLAAGCPSVTIGITRGGNAHRLDEYVELQHVKAGLRQLILLTLAATGTENL